MHHVSKIDSASAQTPALYQKHSTGFGRATYVDRAVGSVHMGVGICFLEPKGVIEPHVHSFEESFYILEGSVLVRIGEKNYALGPGNFGLIGTGVPHAWRNTGDRLVRWLEMQAPQPRPLNYGRDTFFVDGDAPRQAAAPNQDPLIGHFDESQLPSPGGASQMEGFNPTTGVAIKMFVDRSFGAIHQSLFLIQYMAGAKIDTHDHTFEESYFIVSGRVRATADGQTYDLGPGDVIWTSVGCIHSFANLGTEPVRWIETQAPLPPAKEVFRFERDWAKYDTVPV
ncbi:MAG TPA: cupin domain-containing protein [Bryobacteraceae bacterium]|jgi:mannose-6-phosphate isomerase-like protein (cupin superfamily)|nr:cupin domain-containing protein [Bryobacteraceae bacterium]